MWRRLERRKNASMRVVGKVATKDTSIFGCTSAVLQCYDEATPSLSEIEAYRGTSISTTTDWKTAC